MYHTVVLSLIARASRIASSFAAWAARNRWVTRAMMSRSCSRGVLTTLFVLAYAARRWSTCWTAEVIADHSIVHWTKNAPAPVALSCGFAALVCDPRPV